MDSIRFSRRQEGTITTQCAHTVGRLMLFTGPSSRRSRESVKAQDVCWGDP